MFVAPSTGLGTFGKGSNWKTNMKEFLERDYMRTMKMLMMMMPGGCGAGHNKSTVLEILGKITSVLLLLFANTKRRFGDI